VEFLCSPDQLEEIYGTPVKASVQKVATQLTDEYSRWIMASKFCALATVGPEGTDCTPRGDEGPVVQILDARTVLMPDWRGNNRIDSLRNILDDGRISLMFMVPGSGTVVRLNGTARLTVDTKTSARFELNGKLPRTVIVIRVGQVYFQCARALMRSGLWGDLPAPADLPTAGDFLNAMTAGEIDPKTYDTAWPDRAKSSLW